MIAARNMLFAKASGFDADAATYFATIVSAGSTISDSNKTAVNAFVVGCKADGIWTAIKACCLLAGPDDLTGALVPLVGTAPTNNGPFISGDYNRTTGLVGNGTSKYLNSNRNNNADPQNNRHMSVYVNISVSTASIGHSLIGVNTVASGGSWLARPIDAVERLNSRAASSSTFQPIRGMIPPAGLHGVNRTGSAALNVRFAGVDYTSTIASAAPISENLTVFSSVGAAKASIPISFYSIGESLDLALLDARLITYMAALT